MIQADLFLHAAYTIFVPMKTPVDIWAELGARLSSFGQDAASREVIARACQKNDWFEPEEIVDAVRSIREEFLSRDKIERWLACYERPATLPSRTVLVVMAGNIPLVGFFDLLCVVTAGHRCLVKMSSKDAVLMSFVIDQLKKIEPGVPVAVYDGATPFDAAIATGSDNANIGNVYTCTQGGDASTALWVYATNWRGTSGSGSVNFVNSVSPDANGNVSLTGQNIPMGSTNSQSVQQTLGGFSFALNADDGGLDVTYESSQG